MQTNPFGRTGQTVTRIGFGAWAIGGTWGEVTEADARATLHAALDAGISFVDTADVYGDGRSERIIRDVLAERGGPRPFVATKAGRRLNPHVAEGYTAANLTAFVDRSLTNLGTDRLDLVQLHCPPPRSFPTPRSLPRWRRSVRPARWRIGASRSRRWTRLGRPCASPA